jgi:hypothetical protein
VRVGRALAPAAAPHPSVAPLRRLGLARRATRGGRGLLVTRSPEDNVARKLRACHLVAGRRTRRWPW